MTKYTAAPAEHARNDAAVPASDIHGDNLATKHRLWIDLTQSANVLNARSVEALLLRTPDNSDFKHSPQASTPLLVARLHFTLLFLHRIPKAKSPRYH